MNQNNKHQLRVYFLQRVTMKDLNQADLNLVAAKLENTRPLFSPI